MKAVEMVRIPADLTKIVERVALAPELDVFQQEVGGYIEAVRIPGAVFWVDEEGQLKDKQFNVRATALARQLGSRVEGLCGDAVLVGYVPEKDEYRDAPSEAMPLMSLIEQILSGVVASE